MQNVLGLFCLIWYDACSPLSVHIRDEETTGGMVIQESCVVNEKFGGDKTQSFFVSLLPL